MIRKRNYKNETPKDIGFGNTVQSGQGRLVNPDGSYNVQRSGLNIFERLSFYHQLIQMSWLKFNLIVVVSYIIANLVFASIYCLIGLESLSGMVAESAADEFMEAFFFSAQTLTTVGYGRINPVGFAASTVSAVESLLGLMGFALATGLIYGRFARPRANILFSKSSVIAPYKEINAFMFRMANARDNQLLDVEVMVTLTYIKLVNGKKMRQYTNLELERSKVNMFPTTWTIVHPIDEKSPFYNMGDNELREAEPEFIIMIKAFDDAFSSTVHARYSYIYSDIKYSEKFVNIHETMDNGKIMIRLNRLDLREPAVLNSINLIEPEPKASRA